MLVALHENVVVHLDAKEERVENGIVIPQNVRQEGALRATVMSAGSEVTTLTGGDRVLLSPSIGKPFERNGMKFATLKASEVLAVIAE